MCTLTRKYVNAEEILNYRYTLFLVSSSRVFSAVVFSLWPLLQGIDNFLLSKTSNEGRRTLRTCRKDGHDEATFATGIVLPGGSSSRHVLGFIGS